MEHQTNDIPEKFLNGDVYKIRDDERQQVLRLLTGLNKLTQVFGQAYGAEEYYENGTEFLSELQPVVEDNIHSILIDLIPRFEKVEK